MTIIDSMKNTAAIQSTNANVLIQLGDGAKDIDIAAANATLLFGDGNLNLDAEISGGLFCSTGDGAKDIDVAVGGNFTLLAGEGLADVNAIVGGQASLTLGLIDLSSTIACDGSIQNSFSGLGHSDAFLDIAAGSNISVTSGNGDMIADLVSIGGISVNAGDGFHDINAISLGNTVANVGDGNSFMHLEGKNVVAETGDGLQVIDAMAVSDAVVKTGESGKDTITVEAGANALVKTNDGDDTVDVTVGGFAYIDAGSTDKDCESDNDTVTLKRNDKICYTMDTNAGMEKDFASLIVNYADLTPEELAKTSIANTIITGDDKDKIVVQMNRVVVDKDNGEMLLGAMGNNYSIKSDAEENTIGAYGNNYTMNLQADAANDVRTLDFWLRDGQDSKKVVMNDGSMMALKDMVDDVHGIEGYTLTEYDAENNAAEVDFFKDNFQEAFDNKTYFNSLDKYELVNTRVDITGMSKDEIADKYNLSSEERAILKDVDLTKTFGNTGAPLYSLALSPKKSKAAGKDVYVVVKTDSSNGNYLHARAVSDYECIAFNIVGTTASGASNVASNVYGKIDSAEKAEDITGKQITTEEYKDLVNYKTNGVMNWTINLNGESDTGSLMANISAYDGLIAINGAGLDSENPDINIIGSHIDSVLKGEKTKTVEDWALSVYVQKNSWNSPLILDMNGDGKISSQAGIGVDTDGDGKVDGAATDGDKMLAMSDMNKNGKIDAAEVFGNNTVSPFTGQKLNAANGFEALKMIAQEAEARGFKCINGTQVDMAELAKALESVGVKLGFVSGTNNTTLEEFSGVKTINTVYDNKTYEGGEQRQYGTFITEDGEIARVDDVWFE